MPTDTERDERMQVERLHLMESSIEALNARIARLAIGLGVSLSSEEDVRQVINRKSMSAMTHERRAIADPRTTTRTGSGADRRVAQKWEELRGLLVLRYGVEARYVDQVGVINTRHILTEAEAHLERDGFKPGADGINLDRLFKET